MRVCLTLRPNSFALPRALPSALFALTEYNCAMDLSMEGTPPLPRIVPGCVLCCRSTPPRSQQRVALLRLRIRHFVGPPHFFRSHGL